MILACLLLSNLLCQTLPDPIANPGAQAKVLPRLKVERATVFQPRPGVWTYSHHSHIVVYRDNLYVIWSNGKSGEDRPGQRILWSWSSDFKHWSEPAVLASPVKRPETILTAGGLYSGSGGLVAYYSSYVKGFRQTQLFARSSPDGRQWSAAKELHLPITPNVEPRPTLSGRLLMSGNFTFPRTDDPSGLTGWKSTTYKQLAGSDLEDNPARFDAASKKLGIDAGLCEGSFFQTDDRLLHMMLRSTGTQAGRLWVSNSKDDGESWSEPAPTSFSDNDAKFIFGRLPDGRFYYVGNPDAPRSGVRKRLILSLSTDGVQFEKHYLIADSPSGLIHTRSGKPGQYGYPDTAISGGYMYVIVSRMKAAIEVIRFDLKQLGDLAGT